MTFNDDNLTDDRDDQSLTTNKAQPNAYRVDDKNIEEKDLKKNYLFGKGNQHAHPTEGTGVGGEKFGRDNLTPSGDDKNNPSRNAGYTNAYFARTEPSEEHPEDSNFTDKNQDGAPDYNKAQPHASGNKEPKPEKVERGNGENDRPHPEQPYTEGTDDNDGYNIPGPNELPDQQKVGEDEGYDDREHIET